MTQAEINALADALIPRLVDEVVKRLRAAEERKLDSDYAASLSIEELKEQGRRQLRRAKRNE